ncbi:MAG: hypothetical protein WCT42_03125 [Candidatus Paceibacterota bacterium]
MEKPPIDNQGMNKKKDILENSIKNSGILKVIKNSKIGKIARGVTTASALFVGAQNLEAQISNSEGSSIANKDTVALNINNSLLPEDYLIPKNYKDWSSVQRKIQTDPESLLKNKIDNIRLNLNTVDGQKNAAKYKEFLANPDAQIGEINEQVQRNREIYNKIDTEVLRMAEQIKSEDYLHKLMTEFNITEEEAKKHQLVRLSNLLNGTYSLRDSKHEDPHFTVNSFNGGGVETVVDSNIYTADHEILGHKSVYGRDGIPQSTKDLFINSYNKIDENTPSFQESIKFFNENEKDINKTLKFLNDYYGRPQEQYARKKTLDMEMENLGIKKYGDKFTQETFIKLMQFYKEGKLSKESTHFIEITKPEYFEKIFNDISQTNDFGKTYYHPGWDYNNDQNNQT